MREIRFTVRRGESVPVLFDDVDAEVVSALPSKRIKSGYAVYEPVVDGKKRTVLVSRMLMGLERGDPLQVDHRNRNRLDNRRANLRVVTRAENQQNLSPMRTRKGVPVRSRYRGVTFFRGRWRAMIQVHGTRYYLGLFDCETDAAQAVALQLVTVKPTPA